MKFTVVIQPEAAEQIDSAYLYIRERAPRAAERWLAGLESAINSLSTHATWHSEAPESAEFDHPIHQLLYGRSRHRYRVIYSISGSKVNVVQVRHGALRPLRRGDL